MTKTRQQLLDEELRKQQKTNVVSMGTQGVSQFTASAQPFVNKDLAPLVMNDPGFAKPSPVVIPATTQGLVSAAPASVPSTAQPVVAPITKPPAQTSPVVTDPTFASVNAQADAQNKRLDAPGLAGAAPKPESPVPVGMMRDKTGKLVSAEQMKAGLASAQVAPDLTEQTIATQKVGQTAQVAQPGQPVMQLGGGIYNKPIPVTNQQFNAASLRTAAAQGGVTNVTPMGSFIGPMNTRTFSPAFQGETEQQARAREADAVVQARTNMARMTAPQWQGSTVESNNARSRQLEQDQINSNRGLMSAQQKAEDRKAMVDAATQRGQNAAMAQAHGQIKAAGLTASRDEDGNPLPEVIKPKDKTARQAALHNELKDLTAAQKADKNNPEYKRAINQKMAEIYEVEGHPELAVNMQRSDYDQLYKEKTNVWPWRGKYAGADAKVEKQLDAEWALTGLPLSQAPHRVGENVKTGLDGAAPSRPSIPRQQQGNVTMVFPDGSKKLVPASEKSKWLALGGKLQ